MVGGLIMEYVNNSYTLAFLVVIFALIFFFLSALCGLFFATFLGKSEELCVFITVMIAGGLIFLYSFVFLIL